MAHSAWIHRARKPGRVTTAAAALAGIALIGLFFACKSKSAGESRGESRSGGTPAAPREPLSPPKTATFGPLSVGQWTRHRVEDRGRTTLISHKVIAEESGAFWVEFVTGTADAGTVLALLFHSTDRKDAARAEVRAAKIRMPNGLLKVLNGPELKPSEAAYKNLLGDLFTSSLQGLPQSDVTTPAATFRGCYQHRRRVALSGSDAESTVWLHPDVPLSAIVKSESADGKVKVELVAFGTEGAESELTRQLPQ
jgi:hypothetical protein